MKGLILVSLVFAMLLFGCASSPPPASPPSGGGQASGNANANANVQAGGSGASSGSGSSGGSVTPPPEKSAVDNLLAALKLSSGWKVTYDIGGMVPGASEMSQYVKGTDKIRSDVTAMGVESRVYVLDKMMYACANTGSWACYKLSAPKSDGSQSSYEMKSNLESNSSKYTVTADGTMQVAGTTATCYKVVSTDSTVRYCVSPEGVPLYVKSTGTSQGTAYDVEMKATSYSTSVADSDFVLPATPQEMNLPGTGTGAGNTAGSGDACSYCSYLTGDQKTQCLSACAG